MDNNRIFLIIAFFILLFSIININIGPILTLSIGMDWGDLNCQILSDEYDYTKEKDLSELYFDSEEEMKYYFEDPIKRCNLRVGMYYLEHITFVFDIVIGFICGLLGFFNYYNYYLTTNNVLISKTGIIGIISGIIGFFITSMYSVYNGLVYTRDFYVLDQDDLFEEYGIFKRDSQGAYAELVDNGEYKCLYHKNYGDMSSLIAKYCDYGKKQYNYDKDLYRNYYDNSMIKTCTDEYYAYNCAYEKYFTHSILYQDSEGESHFCPKLYMPPLIVTIPKNLNAKFLVTLIFSLLICLCCLGLIIFGFLLIQTPGL